MTLSTPTSSEHLFILEATLPPLAVAALKRKAERDGTSVRELVKDALYNAAVTAILEEHAEELRSLR